MSEPTIDSVLRAFGLDLCEGGAACDETECVGSRKIAGEVLTLRTALTLATQRAEQARGDYAATWLLYTEWADWAHDLIAPWTHLDSGNVAQSGDAQSVIEARLSELTQRAEAAEAELSDARLDLAKAAQRIGKGDAFRAKLLAERDAIRAERDALREDAARLDWLESRSSFLVHQWQGGGYTLTLPQPPIDGVRPPPIGVAGDAFRQAIDAAMAVQP